MSFLPGGIEVQFRHRFTWINTSNQQLGTEVAYSIPSALGRIIPSHSSCSITRNSWLNRR